MRDLKRIERICSLLKEKWEECPDLRLGQFLLNWIFDIRRPSSCSILMYRQEDDLTEKRLEEFEKIRKEMYDNRDQN